MINPAERLLKEMQQKAHLSGFQLELVWQYIQWAYVTGYDAGRIEWIMKRNSSKRRKVIGIDRFGNQIGPFISITQAAKELGLRNRGISKSIKFSIRHKGYYWRYADGKPGRINKKAGGNLAKPPA